MRANSRLGNEPWTVGVKVKKKKKKRINSPCLSIREQNFQPHVGITERLPFPLHLP